MKGDLILLDHLGDTESAALIRDGRLEDLLIEHQLLQIFKK